MNKQEIFNIIWNGLKSQKFKQSSDGNGSCLYRNGKLKCAIGHLIPDHVYEDSMEGDDLALILNQDSHNTLRDWWHEEIRPIRFDSRKMVILDDTVNLLSDLQNIHDTTKSPKKMEAMIRDLAKYEGLDIPEDDIRLHA